MSGVVMGLGLRIRRMSIISPRETSALQESASRSSVMDSVPSSMMFRLIPGGSSA
jgi:hypothetical protein